MNTLMASLVGDTLKGLDWLRLYWESHGLHGGGS